METKSYKVSLTTLCDGDAVKLFNIELGKVLQDIIDPNSKPDQVRDIKLVVKIKPDQDRNMGQVSIDCVSTGVGRRHPLVTVAAFGTEEGKPVAYEFRKATQDRLFPQGKVTEFKKQTGSTG